MTGLNLLSSRRNSAAFSPGYAPTDFGDVASSAFTSQRANYNLDAEIRLVGDPLAKRNSLLKERLGKDISDITGTAAKYTNPNIQGQIAQARENNDLIDGYITAGRKENPALWDGIETTAEIRAQGIKTAQEATTQSEDVMSRNPSSVSRTVGAVVGGIGGAFTDPINIVTLPLGAGETKILGTGAFAFAKGLAVSAAKEGAIQAAIEAASVPQIAQWQKQLGHTYGLSEAATDVAFGFAGGAGIRAVSEGIVPALRGARRSIESVSSVALDKIAASPVRMPQSVRDSLKYMSRTAYVDESTPSPPRNQGDIQEHRAAVNKTGSDINSYRRPAAEMQPADLQVPRAPDIAPPSTAINRTEQDVFIETARDLINDLKSYVQFDINKPSDVKRVIGYIPDTLSQFVRKNGGIADAGGELANMGVTHKSLPGLVRNSNATSGVDMFGATRKNAQIDIVREKVFDAGFFPEKNNYNEISDSDLFQAIADDVNGKKRYSVDDLDRISVAREGSDLIRQYEAIGITSDMTEKEIADRLREIKADQEVQFDENAYSMREYRDTVIDPPVEIKPSDRFEASRASFKNLSDEEPDMLISFEDGSTLKLSEYAERMKEYDNILEAITTCRLA